MASEITVICMDTSRWMQYNRSHRFLAQAEAIELYCKEKIDFHPENRVSILAMGDVVYKLVEPTRDLQKIMSSIHGAKVDNLSVSCIVRALKMADDFLRNNIMYKRVVVFAGGPVYWFKDQLRGIGTNLKEKGVAVDVINFGDMDGPRAGQCCVSNDNRIVGESKKASLEALVTAANHNDNSHILHVPQLNNLYLRYHLSWSPILSRTRRMQCCSNNFESIIARQKAQNDELTQENEKLKRELEFYRNASLKFVRKVQDHDAQNW